MYNKRNYGVMPRTFGGLLEDVFQNGWTRINDEIAQFAAPVNIQETDKSYDLSLVAPGLKKDDFKVNIDKNTLTISYDHKEESKETTAKVLRTEYRTQSFKRSFKLNDKIDVTNISAKYVDGILNISMAKKEDAAPATQEITVG